MKNFGRCLLLSVCLGGVLPGMAMAPRPPRMRETLVLVAPARLRALQAAFDVQHLRGATLFAYRNDPGRPAPDIFQWSAGAWQLLAGPEFAAILQALPGNARVALVGGAGVLPEQLAGAVVNLAPNVTRLATIQPVDIFNGLDEICRFTPREWQWLAERYELTLTDENAARRAYNPYAVRRSELPLSTDEFPVEEDDLPPAAMELPAE